MTNYEIFAIILFIIGGLCKAPRKTIAIYILSDLLFFIVYLQMSLYLAAVSIGLGTIRGISSLFLNEKQNQYVVIFVTCLIIGFIAFEINHAVDGLIVVAAIAIGLSFHFRDNFVMYRLMTMTSQVLWIVHSLIFAVYGMAICATIILCTCLWALYKYSDLQSVKSELVKNLLFFKKTSA